MILGMDVCMSDDDADASSYGFDRRTFMKGVSAAGLTAGIGVPSVSGSATGATTSRRDGAENARSQHLQDLVGDRSVLAERSNNENGSSTLQGTPGGPAQERYDPYRKGLPGASGPVSFVDYEEMVNAIEDQNGSIPQDGDRAHVEPYAANHFPADGIDSHMAIMPPNPSYKSDTTAASMLDLYYMAHLRDTPLADLTTEATNAGYDTEMSVAGYDSAYEFVDFDYPLRGAFIGTKRGPYLSQFYLHEAKFGNLQFSPQVEVFEPGVDYGTSQSEYADIREGRTGGAEPGGNLPKPEPSKAGPADDPDTRWIATGRDLASLVRDEPAYQHYYMAAMQLCDWGANFRTLDVETENADEMMKYINYGKNGVLDLLARVARNALLAAWHHKWNVHLRVRPEGYGGDVAEQQSGYTDASGYNSKLAQSIQDSRNSGIVDTIASNNGGDAYLPLAYPEGAPAHPAYPSGHSAIAGACVTALKSLFEDANLNDLDVTLRGVPETPGDDPADSPGRSFSEDPTVHSELNKLADNIGVARLWAGVHYWHDHLWGVRLGEQVAIATVTQHLNDDNSLDGPDHVPVVRSFKPTDMAGGSITIEELPVTANSLEAIRTECESTSPVTWEL